MNFPLKNIKHVMKNQFPISLVSDEERVTEMLRVGIKGSKDFGCFGFGVIQRSSLQKTTKTWE